MAEDGLGVAVVDVSGTDGISIHAEVVLQDDPKPFWTKKTKLRLPEEDMDKLEALIGDGNASITVGNEMKESADFATAGCSVFVKLTCGQTEAQIAEAREYAQQLALSFAAEGYEQARYVLDSALGRNPARPASMGEEEKKKPDKTPKKVKNKTKDPEDRGQASKSKLLKGRPSFKR